MRAPALQGVKSLSSTQQPPLLVLLYLFHSYFYFSHVRKTHFSFATLLYSAPLCPALSLLTTLINNWVWFTVFLSEETFLSWSNKASSLFQKFVTTVWTKGTTARPDCSEICPVHSHVNDTLKFPLSQLHSTRPAEGSAVLSGLQGLMGQILVTAVL